MASFSILVNDTTGFSLADLTARVARVPAAEARVQLNELIDYLSGLNSGSRLGTMDVTLASAALVAATGTVTCASVAAADTVTVNGTALTAVDKHETTQVVCVADTAGSLNDTYFNIYSAADATKYYVWYNVNAAGTDPEIENSTGIEVALATGATDSTVATATKTALDAVAGTPWITTRNTATLTIRCSAIGATTNSTDGAAPTGFTITTTVAGGSVSNNEFDIGTSNTQCGDNLVSAITGSTTALISGLVTAVNVSGAVTLSAIAKGVVGNAYTLASSNGTRLAVTGTTNGRLIGGTGGFSSTVTVYSHGA